MQKKTEDALRIYTVGLRRSKHLEIEKQIRLTKQQAIKCKLLRNGIDIFSILPGEILVKILRFLDWRTKKELLELTRTAIAFRKKEGLGFFVAGERASEFDYPLRYCCCASTSGVKVLTVVLRKKGGSSMIQKLHIESIDLQAIIQGVDVNQLFSRRIRSISCKRCIITEDCIDYLKRFSNPKKITWIDCQIRGETSLDPHGIWRYHNDDDSFSNPICRDAFRIVIRSNDNPLSVLPYFDHVQSIHIVNPFFDLRSFLNIIPKLLQLREVGIHAFTSDSPLDPKEAIEKLLLLGSKKRILCLPILNSLPHDRKWLLTNIDPDCRLIFDQDLSMRVLTRSCIRYGNHNIGV